MVDIPALETDAAAFADVVGGDDATIGTASNGRQTPSMLKVIKDQIRWKPPILWSASVSVTDVLQPYESVADGHVYAPAPGVVPFTAVLDPQADPTNWQLVQGYVNGGGTDLDLGGIGQILDIQSIQGDVDPSVDATYDLGSLALQWSQGFFSGDVFAGPIQLDASLATGIFGDGTNANAKVRVNSSATGNPSIQLEQAGAIVCSMRWDHATSEQRLLSDGAIRFFPGNADRLSLNAAGDYIPTGDGTQDIGAAVNRIQDIFTSGGIYIGGAVAANYLDDYEEGLWTPVLQGATIAGAFTYTTQSGTYTKIGNRVTIRARINISVTSVTPTGALQIAGLPFTSVGANPGAMTGGGEITAPVNVLQIVPYSVASDTIIQLAGVKDNAAADVLITGGDIGTTPDFFITLTYEV